MAKITGKRQPRKAAGDLIAESGSDAMKAARKLIDIYNSITDAREELDIAGKEVVELMKKENRSRIVIEGYTVQAKYTEARVKVKITKPRM